MKLKRILAPDTPTATEQVIETFGESALIISNRRVNDQVELIVAVDSMPDAEASTAKAQTATDGAKPDQTAQAAHARTQPEQASVTRMPAALGQDSASAPAEPPEPATREPEPTEPEPKPTAPAPVSKPTVPQPNDTPLAKQPAPSLERIEDALRWGLDLIAQRIDDLTANLTVLQARVESLEPLRQEIAELALAAKAAQASAQASERDTESVTEALPPDIAALHHRLEEAGAPKDLVATLLLRPPSPQTQDLAVWLHARIRALIPVGAGLAEPAMTSGIHVLYGPPGSGTTTNSLRFAARGVSAHGIDEVALIRLTNEYRLASPVGLSSAGNTSRLGITHIADPAELPELVDEHLLKKLLIIDVGNLMPDDGLQVVKNLLASIGLERRARYHLVLAADLGEDTLDALLGRPAPHTIADDVILTRVDCVKRPWQVFASLAAHPLPVLAATETPKLNSALPSDTLAPLANRLVSVFAS